MSACSILLALVRFCLVRWFRVTFCSHPNWFITLDKGFASDNVSHDEWKSFSKTKNLGKALISDVLSVYIIIPQFAYLIQLSTPNDSRLFLMWVTSSQRI